jgi:hypothetical protein
MPDFELWMQCDDRRSPEQMRARLALYFPEIEIVGRYLSEQHEDELWICRAPSVAHLERWVAEEPLRVTRIRRLAEP